MAIGRIIGSLFLKKGIVVQSIGFNDFRPIGRPEIACEAFCRWSVDEILVLDIDAPEYKNTISMDIVRSISKTIDVPLTIGGGIKTLDQAHDLICSGADKICINSSAFEDPRIITEMSQLFGAQSVSVCLDTKNGLLFSSGGMKEEKMPLIEAAQYFVDLGAGELILHSIDRDGNREGYHIELVQTVEDAVTVPIIALGGCGTADDVVNLFKKTRASAAIGNILNYTEHSIANIKNALIREQLSVRPSTIYGVSNHV